MYACCFVQAFEEAREAAAAEAAAPKAAAAPAADAAEVARVLAAKSDYEILKVGDDVSSTICPAFNPDTIESHQHGSIRYASGSGVLAAKSDILKVSSQGISVSISLTRLWTLGSTHNQGAAEVEEFLKRASLNAPSRIGPGAGGKA